MKFTYVFCYCLGLQVNEAEAFEKLEQLDMKSNSSRPKSVLGKDATRKNLSLVGSEFYNVLSFSYAPVHKSMLFYLLDEFKHH